MTGLEIKQIRTELGLSVKEFAEKIGVSASAIYMYEQGNRTPNNDITQKILRLKRSATSELYQIVCQIEEMQAKMRVCDAKDKLSYEKKITQLRHKLNDKIIKGCK